MLRKTMLRPTVTRSNPHTFHPDMLDETKTMLRLTGDIQEGVGALAPSDFGVDVTVTAQVTVRPSSLYTGHELAFAEKIKITPVKILLNDLEDGYRILKPIPVDIREAEDSFVASFTTANINSSGDSWEEAVTNLQSLLLDMYDSLLSEKPNALGREPKRQLAVLQSFIIKTEDAD
jgi:hypothetical protein